MKHTPGIYHFHVVTPDMSMTVIGGPLKPADEPGFVWLTKPGGEPILKLRREWVQPCTSEQTAARLAADARAYAQRN